MPTPLPPLMELKFQRETGIMIGFAIGLIALGFGAAFTTNLSYNEFARALSYQGITTDTYFLDNY